MGSNALAFKNWAANENVITTTPVEQFRGRRIGIDADDYLQTLLVSGNREPLLPAHGGKPFTLTKRVDEDLESFRAAGIEPIFVFNGLDLACKDRASILNESRRASGILNEAWQIYDQGKGEDAVLMFGKACKYQEACNLFDVHEIDRFQVHTEAIILPEACRCISTAKVPGFKLLHTQPQLS